MKMWRLASAVLFAGLLAGCAVTPPPPLPADHNGPPEIPPPVLQISAERMSEITRVLASDEFQGHAQVVFLPRAGVAGLRRHGDVREGRGGRCDEGERNEKGRWSVHDLNIR